MRTDIHGAHHPHRGRRHGRPSLPGHRGGGRAAPARSARRASSSSGTPRGLESRLVPRAGYELELLPILPLNGVGLARAAAAACSPCPGRSCAARRARAAPAAGGGARRGRLRGRAGGARGRAACGCRTVILEPNATPGFTNRVLRPFVRRAACSYEAARADFGAQGRDHRQPGARRLRAPAAARSTAPPFTLLVFGGQPGLARPQPRRWSRRCRTCPGADRLRIVHQTGEAMREEVAAAYARGGARGRGDRLPRRHGGALRPGRPRALAAAGPPPAPS